jgi:hypothetical protein
LKRKGFIDFDKQEREDRERDEFNKKRDEATDVINSLVKKMTRPKKEVEDSMQKFENTDLDIMCSIRQNKSIDKRILKEVTREKKIDERIENRLKK